VNQGADNLINARRGAGPAPTPGRSSPVVRAIVAIVGVIVLVLGRTDD